MEIKLYLYEHSYNDSRSQNTFPAMYNVCELQISCFMNVVTSTPFQYKPDEINRNLLAVVSVFVYDYLHHIKKTQYCDTMKR